MNRFLFVFAGGLAFAAFAAGLYLALTMHRGDAAAITGFLWPEPPRLATFELDRDDGTKLTEQDFRGRWTLVFFGFSNCPDVCPTTMNTLARVVEKLQSEPALAEVLQVVFVSVDPARDKPEMLRAYVDYFNEDFIGATANKERLAEFAAQFGVLYMKIETPGQDGYTMDHSASVLLVDPALNTVGLFSQPHIVDDIALSIIQIVDYLGIGS
jgi:protein SCO1/2